MKRIRIEHVVLAAVAIFSVWALDFEHSRHTRAMERAAEYAESQGQEVTGVACVKPTLEQGWAMCASFPSAGAPYVVKCEDSFWARGVCEPLNSRAFVGTL